MKNFVTVISGVCLGMASAGAYAATAAAETGAAHAKFGIGGLAAINSALVQIGQMINFGGANIFWVLGGGLVGLSLVARRTSA